MKTLNRTALALAMLSALPLMAATTSKVINVTTFADENGENSGACSLREALTAAETNQAYGGCTAGDTSSSVTDTIQLKAGSYVLSRPLQPRSSVSILGDAAVNWDKLNPLTNDYPQILPLATSLSGNGSFTLFDTTATQKPALTLTNIKLSNASASSPNGRGGLILAGGSVNLKRVILDQANAADSGGAVYLSGTTSNLNMVNSVISNAHAPHGAAIGMSCLDNLTFTPHTVTITGSSIINNGDASAKSVIALCGTVSAEISSSTIAQNMASGTDGSIIKFSADSQPNNPATTAILSNQSNLTLTSNTLVDNSASATFLYDSVGLKSLSYNLLAFNTGASCRHLLGGVTEQNQTAGLSLWNNAFNVQPGSPDYCAMPTVFAKQTLGQTIDTSRHTRSSLLSTLQQPSEQTLYMPLYYPNNTGSNPLIDVADSNANACSGTDQRGINRQSSTQRLITSNVNRCDIGSTELSRLAAADLSGSNNSQSDQLKGFADQVSYFQKLIDDKTTPVEFLNFYATQRDQYQQRINDYKAQLPYRGVLFDVYKNSVPNDLQNADGSRTIRNFDPANYTITTQALSTGADIFASGNVAALPTTTDPALKCEWNPVLKQVVMYRTDGQISAAGDYSYCTYTITDLANPASRSTGILQARFDNIAPNAINHGTTLVWGTDQRVKLDLLNSTNFNDDGDGVITQSNYPQNKLPYYTDPKTGVSAPVKFAALDSALQIEAQYSLPCPDESGSICYGGDIYIKPKNSFNKFNYPMQYQIFDADGTLSNTATITLTNTATTTDDTRKGSSGGSFGGWSVLGLLGLAILRQRQKRK